MSDIWRCVRGIIVCVMFMSTMSILTVSTRTMFKSPKIDLHAVAWTVILANAFPSPIHMIIMDGTIIHILPAPTSIRL